VHLPEATAQRLEAVAAARGETVQELVGNLVERFLADEDRKTPNLEKMIGALRDHATVLRAHGVTGLWIFGSVARDQARPNSDIDLVADFATDAPLSLVKLASLRAALSDLLGAPADLAGRGSLKPAVREAAEREGIRVL
jgi:predicted nucleotidyltransferase